MHDTKSSFLHTVNQETAIECKTAVQMGVVVNHQEDEANIQMRDTWFLLVCLCKTGMTC